MGQSFLCVFSINNLNSLFFVSAVEARVHLVRVDKHYPFSIVCETKAVVSRVIEGSPKDPTTILTRDLLSVTVYGEPVSIKGLQEGVPKLIAEIEKHFREKVCCGYVFDELEKTVDAAFDPHNKEVYVQDNQREDTIGYSVF